MRHPLLTTGIRAILLVIVPTSLIVLTGTTEASAGEHVEMGTDRSTDGQGGTHVGAHDESRVTGKYRGKVPISPRTTVDDTASPIYTVPCQASPAPTPTGPVVRAVSNTGDELDFQLAADSTSTIDTAEFDPTRPPRFYFAVCDYAQPQPASPETDRARATAWVADYFRRSAMPIPKPEISAPNGGVCGVLHTIDLHMKPELLFRERSTPFGSLTLHTYGSVSVNWGDGDRNTYTDGGGPYPESSIHHVWTERGTYDVDTTVNWIANYTLGPYNGVTYRGVLTGVTTHASIEDFRMYEAQAMLTNDEAA